MRFVIRADAQKAIGSGHVTRCVAVAEELIRRGSKVFFVGTTKELPWVSNLVESSGFFSVLCAEAEFESNPETDILILDSYSIKPDSSFIQLNHWRNVVVLKDPNTPNYKSHLDIHLTIGQFCPMEDTDSIQIGGPKYFPIRKILQINPSDRAIAFPPRILVTSGGSELPGVIHLIIKSLSELDFDFEAIVISDNPNHILDSRFVRYPTGGQFHELLKGVSFVCTSAGVTSIELAANRIPMGVYCSVANQRDNYEILCSKGLAIPLGSFDLNCGEIRQEEIRKLFQLSVEMNPDYLFSKFELDFQGADRIVNQINSLLLRS